MKTRITLLLLAATLCCTHAEQIVLDDAVTYELDNTTMTASLVKSTYPYGLMDGYYRDTEEIREIIDYEGDVYQVTSIGENAFSSQTRLKGVVIPYGLKIIGASAFAGCLNLENTNFPESLDSIGNSAFANCTLKLEDINLPLGVKLGENVFSGCGHLKTAFINSDIPAGTFRRCLQLSSITIGNNCTQIGSDAFNNCSELSEITIPNEVDNIGIQAFMYSGLTTIAIPAKVKTIDESAFAQCSNLESVSLGTGVTRIEKTAFWNCPSLTEITIPEQVEYVGLNAFLGCSSLSSVTWNAQNCAIFDVTSQRPFSKIETNITSFVFGSKVQSIPDNLCNGMENLEHITAYMANPPQISASVFENCGNLKDIVCYVLTESLNAYKTADVWKDFNITATGQEPVISTYYTVTFKDWDGTILKTEQVEEGQSATAPADPTREGYTFIGWDNSFTNVQSDLVVTAQYQKDETPINAITVRLKASSVSGWSSVYLWAWTDEGNIFSSWPGQKINEDSEGWYSYTFAQGVSSVSVIWNNGSGAQTKDISGITESTCYELNSTSGTQITVSIVDCPAEVVYYTVRFKDWNGTVLKTEQVEDGKSATAPADPTRDGYTFIGWDKDFTNVHSNLIVTAQYQKNATPTDAITVRLKASSAPNWSSVYLWAWTDEGNIFSSWPGQKINEDSDGWYSFTFAQEVSNVSIIWNNGSSAQTKDISGITESTCYLLNSTEGSNIAVSVVDCDAQGVEDIHIDSTNNVQKILYEGQLFILRGDKTYTVQGQEVR